MIGIWKCRFVRATLMVLGAGFLLSAEVLPVRAGVGLPPMPDSSDTNAMEQYRVKVFYDAQKSEQDKIRVGQERYERKMASRSNTLAAMAAEVAERQQAIVIPSAEQPEANADQIESGTWKGTLFGALVIGAGVLGFRYYLCRQDSKDLAAQKY